MDTVYNEVRPKLIKLLQLSKMPGTVKVRNGPHSFTYNASKTCGQFIKDDSFVRGLIGPLGSGKSVACCMDLFLQASEQAVSPIDNVRYSRWAIIRNTYRELVDTTMNTWFQWFPEYLGLWRAQDMKFTLQLPLPDGTYTHSEFLFRALDKPQDVKKLLSLELTGAWVNEAREIPRSIIDMLMGRVGRYPSKAMGGPTWWGIIMDTNPCDTDNWWYKIFEEIRPENHTIFHQPSGLSDKAENIENLPPLYYENMMQGKDQEWINVYVHGKYGFVSDGKPVYPEYNDDVHFSHHVIEPVPDETLYIGIDFGTTPSAEFAQKINGQWRYIDEIVTENFGAIKFGELLGQHLRQHYRGYTLLMTGDPAGNQHSQTDYQTPFEILEALGIHCDPCHTNDFTIRRETFAKQLGRLTFTGEPGLVISPNCPMLRRGLAGGYKFKRLQVSGEERYKEEPDKLSRYSHPCDAAQYLLLGAGEDDSILGNTANWDLDYSQLDRAAK